MTGTFTFFLRAWLLLGLVCCSGAIRTVQPAQDLNTTLQKTRQAAARQDWSTTRDAASTVLARHNEHPEASYYLALALDALNESARAYEVLQNSLAGYPDYAPNHRLLGYLYLNDGRWLLSVRASRTALEIAPTDQAAEINLAYALYRLAQYDQAYLHYQKILSREPVQREALLYSALLLQQMGRLDESAERFERSLRAHPDDAEILFHAASFLTQRHSDDVFARADEELSEQQRAGFERARQYLLRSIAAQADVPESLALLAYIELRLGHNHQAIQFAGRTLALTPQDAATRFNLGLAYYRVEKFLLARRQFETVLATHPETLHALLFAGNASMRMNDLTRAREFYERILAINDQHALAHWNLAQLYTVIGEKTQSRHHQKQACDAGLTEACTD